MRMNALTTMSGARMRGFRYWSQLASHRTYRTSSQGTCVRQILTLVFIGLKKVLGRGPVLLPRPLGRGESTGPRPTF